MHGTQDTMKEGSMSEKLKPCPFCGVTPDVEFELGEQNWKKWFVKCHTKYCPVDKTDWSVNKQIAIDTWNTRHKEERG